MCPEAAIAVYREKRLTGGENDREKIHGRK
jgi:hypothetical protein